MNSAEKRRQILKQLYNTLVTAAVKNKTILVDQLIGEICRSYEVSIRTANTYIRELVITKIAYIEGNYLYHRKESEIRLEYLKEVKKELPQMPSAKSSKNQKEVIQK